MVPRRPGGALDGDVLVLAVPNAVVCERIRSNYTSLLTDLLHEATGDESSSISWSTPPRAATSPS